MKITIGQVVNGLVKGINQLEHTVDNLIAGHMDMDVKGIVTTFSASQHIIEQAVALNANLIITHEGVFYSHQDTRDELKNDPVYEQKSLFIQNSGIGIFRFHDYVHRFNPDGIMTGLLQALDWETNVIDQQPAAAIIQIPAMQVREVAAYLKRKLKISFVRVTGEPSMVCRRIGILVGYRGSGGLAIPLFQKESLDLIIAGEGPEWETPEYVKDALQQGRNKALIMLGHAESEAPGMKYLASLLSAQYPMLPVHFLADHPIYQIL
jgi:putative NIF3 family GTP cyclohydrolase 1 type 2